jgi:hypothetical protein
LGRLDRGALTERLAIYVTFVAAVVVSLWTARRPPGMLRLGMPALAMLAILPNPAAGVWSTRVGVPTFFTDSAYRGCLNPGETILPLPVASQSESMLWQVEDGFRFRMAGGNIAPNPPEQFLAPSSIALVASGGAIAPGEASALATYIRVESVGAVVVDSAESPQWVAALDRLARPDRVGGVLLYRFAAGSGHCGPAAA